jgi:hypothetical protein
MSRNLLKGRIFYALIVSGCSSSSAWKKFRLEAALFWKFVNSNFGFFSVLQILKAGFLQDRVV